MSSGDSNQTEATLKHHLQAIGEGNVDEILADYTEESILCTPDSTLRGPSEIRQMFEKFFSEMLPPGSQFNMIRQYIYGDVAFIVWSAESKNFKFPIGTDTFIIRDGKIVTQTFAAHIVENG